VPAGPSPHKYFRLLFRNISGYRWGSVSALIDILRAGRRRGDDIRDDRAKAATGLPALRHEPSVTWPSAREVLDGLKTRVEAKSHKGYPPDTVLAVYLNVGDWDNNRQEIEAGMADALNEALSAFAAFWILWHGRLYLGDETDGLRLASG
jgi:hypothetical protein